MHMPIASQVEQSGQLGFEMITSMERRGLSATPELFVPVLRFYCRKGDMDRALEVRGCGCGCGFFQAQKVEG
jgi:hypothetical protein